MDLKQCTGCQSMVDSQKAYCPDCGAPMDEEQKRESSSEFDNLAKTQNLNSTMQKQLLENLNLSFIFAKKDLTDSSENKIEPEKESFNKQQVETKTESFQPPSELKNESFKPTPEPVIPKAAGEVRNEPALSEKARAAIEPQTVNQTTAQTVPVNGKKFNQKIFLIIGLSALALFVLFLLALTMAILGYVYYWQR